MEIPVWWFFSFGALISITFLHLGFYALDQTDLSNSVSPIAMFFFKHSLAISSCTSSNYALIFRHHRRYDADGRYFWVAFAVLPVLIHSTVRETAEKYTISVCLLSYALIKFSWLHDFVAPPANRYYWFTTPCFVLLVWFPAYSLVFALIHFILVGREYQFYPPQIACIAIHMAIGTSLFFENTKRFFPFLVLFVSFFSSAFLAISGLEPWADWAEKLEPWADWAVRLKPVAVKVKGILSTVKEKTMGKMMEFAVGMGGTLLFQYFFKLTSFNEVMAFLCLALAWVANMGLTGLSGDLGVLNFLLGNVVVGCTVNEFGLRATTWLAYGASLLLFGLRLKLDSWTAMYLGQECVYVRLWFEPYRLPV